MVYDDVLEQQLLRRMEADKTKLGTTFSSDISRTTLKRVIVQIYKRSYNTTLEKVWV